MADYYTLLTNAGIAYETACKAAGLPIKLTQMSVGDGNGAVYNPAATATALKREVWRGSLNALFQDEKNPSWLLAEVTIPPEVGGWYVREAGLWTDTGILYAIVKYPESFKPVLATSGSGKEFYIRSIFETSNASEVTLLIDDNVVKATRAWVMGYVADELAKLDSKQSVRVAATGNVVLSGAQQIDGVAVTAGQRVLLPLQTSAKENGIWIVANGAWSRAADANTSAKVTPGLSVMVEEGVANGDSLWHLVTNGPIVLDTTPLVFEMLAGRTGIVPGAYRALTIDKYGRAIAGSNPETLAGMGITDAYTSAQVDALIAKATAMPVGAIVSFPVDKQPAGFLELDGSVKSVAAYPDLSAFLGTAFNKGNEGAGNFRLPDLRAEFLRGWDHGRGYDVGRAIGSAQLGTLAVFDSNYTGGQSVDIVRGSPVEAQADLYRESDYPGVGITFTSANVSYSPYPSAGGVTRPRNVAVMWCIKAWSAPVNQGVIDVGVLADEVRKATGRFLGLRRIRATQIYWSTPGTVKIRVKGQGAGAAGGGAASTANGQVSAGCGGGAGAPFDTWITSGFDGVMVTIGKGGTGVLVGPGNNGGATSFGSHVTAPGGIGGGLSANVVPPLYLGQTPNSQPAVGATVKNGQGKGGGGVIGPKTDFVVSGEGGPSEMGPGGNSISTSSQGADAVNPGSGGGGAVALPSYPAHLRGGHGADGWIDVEEWA